MKAQLFYRLHLTEGSNTQQADYASQETAQQEYSERLESLQASGQPFQISMSLQYNILHDDGREHLERYYLLSAHDENGAFNSTEVAADRQLLIQHLQSGFISLQPGAVLWPAASAFITGYGLENGQINSVIL